MLLYHLMQGQVFVNIYNVSHTYQLLCTYTCGIFHIDHHHSAVGHPGNARRMRQHHTMPIRVFPQQRRGVAGVERVLRHPAAARAALDCHAGCANLLHKSGGPDGKENAEIAIACL